MRKLTFILLVFSLAACTRSATSSSIPTPTEDPLESIFKTIATQTALAAGNKSGPELNLTVTSTSLFGSTATLAPSPTIAPTASKTPAPTEELSVPSTYTLHEGEWPYCIARRFNIDPDSLLAANGLTSSNANSLPPGYKLTIPVGAAPYGGDRALRSHPTTYVTSGSETFYSIGCAFGDVWPEHIAEANGMDINENIPSGTQLYIP